MKIRQIVIALLALLTSAFMPPLVSLLGGLTLLIGAGVLIFRDLPPAGQDAVERRILGWLHRARAGSVPEAEPVRLQRPLPGIPAERARRVRAKIPTAGRVDGPQGSPPENDATGQ